MPRLQWLACPPQQAQQREPSRTPAGTLVYAIGDIHGRCDLLEALLQGIEQDCEQRPHKRTVVIYLGDYLSRGTDSRAVVDRVMSWQPQTLGAVEIITLNGNHEELALRYLHGELEAARE
jgi:serine/threonine protein phosphatase 1